MYMYVYMYIYIYIYVYIHSVADWRLGAFRAAAGAQTEVCRTHAAEAKHHFSIAGEHYRFV